MELTYGEKVVRTKFNVTGNPDIDTIKNDAAKAINTFVELSLKSMSKLNTERTTREKAEEIEARQSENSYLMKKAVDAYELAAMYAVKALTV